MSKKKYTKFLLEVEEIKLQSIIALSFGEGTTNSMEGKSAYSDYEEEEENE